MAGNRDLTLDDFETSVVELTDEEGNVVAFDHIATVEYQGHSYVLLVPAEETDDEEGDVVILRIVPGQTEDTYETVDDDLLLQEVFNHFADMSEQDDAD